MLFRLVLMNRLKRDPSERHERKSDLLLLRPYRTLCVRWRCAMDVLLGHQSCDAHADLKDEVHYVHLPQVTYRVDGPGDRSGNVTTLKIDWTSHRVLTWTGMGAATAAAWIALVALHGDARIALDTLAMLCLQIGASATMAMYPAVLVMWLLMSVAMMLPTALPTIDLYVRLSKRMEEGRTIRIVLFVAGYLVAWGGFGAIAAGAQVVLGAVPDGVLPPLVGAGTLLLLIGAYQLSPIKQACLDLCRNPLLFLMSSWREDLPGTLGLGIRHGIICIGCCWALMLLMFLSGAMNLVWMALLGLLMLAEKSLFAASSWRMGGGALLIGSGIVLIAIHLT